MTSAHRLAAIAIVWAAFAWTSFFMFGISATLFLSSAVVVTLSVLFVAAALTATYLILCLGQREV